MEFLSQLWRGYAGGEQLKRIRGACKGCKCATPISNCWFCEIKNKKIRQPPKECDSRIDAATYLNEDNNK